jgi:hypothetical protein
VVHDGGDPAAVLAEVAHRTGLPLSQFEATALDSLLRATPRVMGGATLRHCAGAPTRAAELRANAVRAEAAWRDGRAAEALDQLDLGIGGLGCLGERVEPPVAARLFQLRGGILAQRGELESAQAELRTALSFAPAAMWDQALPSEGLTIFHALRSESPSARLRLAPAGASVGPSVDGRGAPAGEPILELRPGLHLVQIPSTAGLRSAWLTVEGDATLIVPGSYRRPVLEQLALPEAAPDVERLLLSTLGVEATYAASGGGLWLISTDESGPHTTTLISLPPPVEAAPEKGRRRDR